MSKRRIIIFLNVTTRAGNESQDSACQAGSFNHYTKAPADCRKL